MDKKIKEKWIKALESGKYKQGKYVLRDGDKFCCLGVLCDILPAPNKKKKWNANNNYTGITNDYEIDSDDDDGIVNEFTKLPPIKITKIVKMKKDTIRKLAELNDNGASFEEIAKYIKRNL